MLRKRIKWSLVPFCSRDLVWRGNTTSNPITVTMLMRLIEAWRGEDDWV